MPIETLVVITTAIANLIGIGIALFKLGGAVKEFKLIGQQQAKEITALNIKTGKITEILTDQKVQEQKHADLTARVSRTEQEIADLRRGEGFILPLAGRQ